jgi:hypothetical protein
VLLGDGRCSSGRHKKELVAISDGYRESTESWAEFLRDLNKRGMRAPVLAVGDGALGCWGAIRDVFPATRHQREIGFIKPPMYSTPCPRASTAGRRLP